MTIRSLAILTALGLASQIAVGGPLQPGSFAALSNGNNIVVSWTSDDESNVVRFELERRGGLSGPFILLTQLPVRGNNQRYEYVDDSAFRTVQSVYQYRLRVIYPSGESAYFGPITVRHDVSSVRRTWGSIKAMFR